MPNWCFTDYVIAGDEKEISDLHDKLSSLPSRDDVHENGFGKFWLGNVVGLFGGNWEQINCRGSLHDLEQKSLTEISFTTETAWGDLPAVWDFVLQQYPSLKYYFYAEECGNCYYATNDHEGKYFPDRFIVDKYAGGSTGYTTRDEAMRNVAAHIVQPVESWADMHSKVEKFNADNVDNEVYIYEIQVFTPQNHKLMATRCIIGIMCEDRIRAIYCHWDGYPEHVGAILCKHYATAEQAEALINLGCISTLGPKLAPDTEFAEPENALHGPGLVRHSFATPQKGVTVAYHRDRDEPLEIFNFYSERGFNHSVRIPVPYHYLFKNGQWYIDGCPLP